jgi:hypothetical protein
MVRPLGSATGETLPKAFSPDGMTVAADGHDNAVAAWDLE